MKGKVRLVLRDKDGNVKKDITDHNFLTNDFIKFCADSGLLSSEKSLYSEQGVNSVFDIVKPFNMGGYIRPRDGIFQAIVLSDNTTARTRDIQRIPGTLKGITAALNSDPVGDNTGFGYFESLDVTEKGIKGTAVFKNGVSGVIGTIAWGLPKYSNYNKGMVFELNKTSLLGYHLTNDGNINIGNSAKGGITLWDAFNLISINNVEYRVLDIAYDDVIGYFVMLLPTGIEPNSLIYNIVDGKWQYYSTVAYSKTPLTGLMKTMVETGGLRSILRRTDTAEFELWQFNSDMTVLTNTGIVLTFTDSAYRTMYWGAISGTYRYVLTTGESLMDSGSNINVGLKRFDLVGNFVDELTYTIVSGATDALTLDVIDLVYGQQTLSESILTNSGKIVNIETLYNSGSFDLSGVSVTYDDIPGDLLFPQFKGGEYYGIIQREGHMVFKNGIELSPHTVSTFLKGSNSYEVGSGSPIKTKGVTDIITCLVLGSPINKELLDTLTVEYEVHFRD